MTNETTCPPPVLWAQKRTDVFVTFNIECKDPDITIEKSSVHFKGFNVRDNKEYEVTIPLHDTVIPEKSNFVNKGRCIEMVIRKENSSSPFWPSLTSDKKKLHYLKTDFKKWCDEDDDEVEESSEIDFSSMMGALDDEDEARGDLDYEHEARGDLDDENLPDLY